MAIGHYESVNGIARKVTKAYDSVNGIARNRIKAYDGVDGVARLFFAPDNGLPVILEVEKITSDTYANETTYTAEEFILLDIYPKSGGTVNVTYGGLTKTIKDDGTLETPNSQRVYFGTFNGVTDSVDTPASGTLTIEGDYISFAVGSFSTSSKDTNYCGCVTAITDWGNLSEATNIISNAFYGCSKLTLSELPSGVTSIGDNAFRGCTSITLSELPSGVTSIGSYAFYKCRGITIDTFPDAVVTIDAYAFYGLPWRNYTFGKSLASIGDSAFYTLDDDVYNASDNTNPRKIYFQGCIPKIETGAFSHSAEYNTNTLKSWTHLYYNEFDNKWDEWAMIGGYNPNAAFESAVYAFVDGIDTRNIAAVALTNNCTEITAYAFYMFNSLPSITIPTSVTKISSYGIYVYEQIHVEMLSTEPPTLISTAFFADASSGWYPTIIVPKGCGETYKAAENWSNFADYIVEAA